MIMESYLSRCESCGGKGWHGYKMCGECLGRGEVVTDQERKLVTETIDNWRKWLKGWREAWNIRAGA
jgi:hypothetical protein